MRCRGQQQRWTKTLSNGHMQRETKRQAGGDMQYAAVR